MDKLTVNLFKIAINKLGSIQCVRVSSAQAKGRAKQYPYWGAARYEIRLRKRDGKPCLAALEAASSDRRSIRLATHDAEEIAEQENRYLIQNLKDPVQYKYILEDIYANKMK